MDEYCKSCVHGKGDIRFCGKCGYTYMLSKYGLPPTEYEAKPKPQTNADRIRSMTDEELAEWLDALITHCNDGPCFSCFMQKTCLTSVADWLKTEVESNDS